MERGFADDFESHENKNVPIEKLGEAFLDIDTYNQESSRSSSISMVQNPSDKVMIPFNLHRISYEEIKKRHEKNLNNGGIEMHVYFREINGEEESIPFSFILKIRSNYDFAEYLSKVNSERLGPNSSELLLNLLKDLNRSILNTASEISQTNNAGLVDVMLGVERIVEQYNRLDSNKKFGFLQTVNQTEEYYKLYGKKQLRESVLMHNWYLDQDFENWIHEDYKHTPATWQRENDIDYFKNNWEGILEVMKELKNIDVFFNSSLEKLLDAILFAKKDIGMLSERQHQHFYDEHLEILEESYHKLRALEFAD